MVDLSIVLYKRFPEGRLSMDPMVHPSPAIPIKELVEKVFNGEGQWVQRQGLQRDIHLLR